MNINFFSRKDPTEKPQNDPENQPPGDMPTAAGELPAPPVETPPPAVPVTLNPPIVSAAALADFEQEQTLQRQRIFMEAEKTRQEIRAETARLIAENARQQAESKRQQLAPKKPEPAKPKTWIDIYEPFLFKNDIANSVRIRHELPGISKAFLLTLMRRGKLESLRATIAQKIAPFVSAWESAFDERATLNFHVVQRQIADAAEKNVLAIESGRAVDIRPMPDRDEIERAFGPKRTALREQMRAAATAAIPYVKEFAAALQTVARDIVVDLVAAEKRDAAEFDAPFQPSSRTILLIAAGCDLQKRIEEIVCVPGPLTHPGEILFGLLDARKKNHD